MGCTSSKRIIPLEKPTRLLSSSFAGSEEQEACKGVRASTFLRLHTKPLSDYRVFEVIGSGRTAEVFKAFHVPTQQFRAIKKISKTEVSRTDFTKEMETLKELDHPNLLRVYEFFEDENFYYIVTELCEGGSLFEEFLRIKKVEESRVAHIAQQVLSALVFCHSRDIIHRDINPENILFKDTALSEVKIIDFGNSVKTRKRKMVGYNGSVDYAAPEIMTGKYTEKVDIWSCGVMLHAIVTGNLSYHRKSYEEIILQIQQDPMKFFLAEERRLSSLVCNFLSKLMQPDYRARVSAFTAMTHPWIRQNPLPLRPSNLAALVKSLKKPVGTSTFKEAVLVFLTSQMIEQPEYNEIKNAFLALDKNRDGKVSKEDLMSVFQNAMKKREAEVEAEKTMEMFDLDKNGLILYTEFMYAALYGKRYNDDVLRYAFEQFDYLGKGFISGPDLMKLFGSGTDLDFEGILKPADFNLDGQIDFSNFVIFMNNNN